MRILKRFENYFQSQGFSRLDILTKNDHSLELINLVIQTEYFHFKEYKKNSDGISNTISLILEKYEKEVALLIR